MSAIELPEHIICIVGPAGAGKDELAQWLHDTYGFDHLSLSDQLRKHAGAQEAGSLLRSSLGALGRWLRGVHGPDILFRETLDEAKERARLGQAAGVLVVTGHWSPEEYDAAKRAGAQFVYMTAPTDMDASAWARIRYERIQERGAEKDQGVTWHDFHERDQRERLGLGEPYTPYDQQAFTWSDDYEVDASAPIDEVRAQAARHVASILGSPAAAEKQETLPARPHWDEETDGYLRERYAQYQLQQEQAGSLSGPDAQR